MAAFWDIARTRPCREVSPVSFGYESSGCHTAYSREVERFASFFQDDDPLGDTQFIFGVDAVLCSFPGPTACAFCTLGIANAAHDILWNI